MKSTLLLNKQWHSSELQCSAALEIILDTKPALSATVADFSMIHYLCQQRLKFKALAFVVHMICG